MSRNISDENLLMNIQLDPVKVEMPELTSDRKIDTTNLTGEEAYLVGEQSVDTDLTPEEIDSISNNIDLKQIDKEITDPTIHQIVAYHVSLLSQRYGEVAVDDFLKNNIYKTVK